MSKRKILVLALSLCMVAILAVGGTLAYFTDTDKATNTFTVGKVDISLIEQERKYDANNNITLGNFTQNKKLYPIVGSAQGVKDKYGMSTAENYVDKIVTVKVNDGSEDAYVRVYVAIPAALETPKAATNILHWNVGNKFTANGDYDTTKNADVADYTANMDSYVQLSGTTTIDGIEYNVYYITYKKALSANQVTGSAFFVGFYLDSGVNTRVDATTKKTVYTITRNNVTTDINFDLTNVKIPVCAIGAQAKGFNDANTALDAAFGANYNPFQ